MRRQRLAAGLVAPVALLLLVVALATLQYRWLGQVSEAERGQLRESLDRRVRDLTEEFDREIGRTFRAFQVDSSVVDPAAPAAFATKYDEWQSAARFPGLLKATWYARGGADGLDLFRYSPESRAFSAADWPASLVGVRERLTRLRPAPAGDSLKGTVFVSSTSPIVTDVPAILVPVPDRLHAVGGGIVGRAAASMMVAMHLDGNSLILEIDRPYLQTAVLPALVSRHFPEDDRYRVAIVDGAMASLFTRGMAEGERLGPETADAAATFFLLRMDAIRDAVSLRVTETARGVFTAQPSSRLPTPTAAARRAPEQNTLSFMFEQRAGSSDAIRLASAGGWHVFVQHSAGSLDAAVAAVRRRNLWLSFGILAVLAASVGLILINARRSERLAAQQMDFVATVSHELRTPLAVIRSAAQNLSAGVVHEPAQASRYGDLIESEGRRLTDMVEQVLEYAGLSGNRRPARAVPVDSGNIVRDVVASCQALLDAERFVVDVDIAPDVPPVMADEGAVRRALHNLITNALKYAADGRWIGISVRAGAVRGGRDVQIAVSDRGRGIDADDLAHIFEPFYRGRYALERQIHGNGLGLSLVKRIADAHGGRISVKSVGGHGATFTLHVPAASRAPALASLSEPAPDAGGSRG